jgi:hypothetical protein
MIYLYYFLLLIASINLGTFLATMNPFNLGCAVLFAIGAVLLKIRIEV